MRSIHHQLADLSASARCAEEAVAAARRESHDRVLQRREQARASAATLADRVEREIRSAGGAARGHWRALRAKVAADIERLRSDHAQREHDRGVRRAADRAARLGAEAEIAIDFALASIEDAKLAVLDSVIAEIEAVEAATA